MASSDYALAVSGIAGPTGGTEFKPVGTVYIGVLTPTNKIVYKSHFEGNREEIQTKSTTFAIEKLAKLFRKITFFLKTLDIKSIISYNSVHLITK